MRRCGPGLGKAVPYSGAPHRPAGSQRVGQLVACALHRGIGRSSMRRKPGPEPERPDRDGRPPRRHEDLGRRLAERIRSLRRLRGLTQEQLAERSELSVDAVRRIERAAFSPTVRTLERIAAGLDTSVPDLFAEPAREPATE